MGITIKDIMNHTNEELIPMLAQEYYKPIPVDIQTVEQMQQAGKMLAVITNEYSYLMVILATLKAMTRTAKKEDKAKYDELLGKRDTVDAFVEVLKQEYQGLSREITTRQEALKEINMSKSI